MTYPHFFFAAMRTIANVARYLLSGGRTMQLEGRFRRGWYRNWSGDRRHRATFCSPKTAGEVSALVRRSSSMRVVGAGHSFNDGLATTGTTVSLDSLARVIKIDRTNRQATVEAGMRLRDLTRELHGEGLALRSLASHDAQSIAGLLSTDVHGTGREPAHMSDQVISLRLVDGNGTVHDVGPGDDLFRAAVGGAGSVGIITQVTLQCVDAFKLRQASHVEDQTWARANLGRLLAEHDHLSFYAYPFTKKIHVHSWDRTDESRSRLGARREALNEAKAALVAATVGDAMAHWGLLRFTAGIAMRLQAPTELVLDSHHAFSRSQYHLHQELEVAVPQEEVWDRLDELVQLYERMYRKQRLPFLLIEIRFSPAGHDRSCLGAGTDRATAWLCLCLNQSGAVGVYFDAVEQWVRSTRTVRIHLGKWCESLTKTDLAGMHGSRFDLFQQVRAAADSQDRFVNPFVERLLV